MEEGTGRQSGGRWHVAASAPADTSGAKGQTESGLVEEQKSPLQAGRTSGFTMDDAETTSTTTGRCSKGEGLSEITISGSACYSNGTCSPAEEWTQTFTGSKRDLTL